MGLLTRRVHQVESNVAMALAMGRVGMECRSNGTQEALRAQRIY